MPSEMHAAVQDVLLHLEEKQPLSRADVEELQQRLEDLFEPSDASQLPTAELRAVRACEHCEREPEEHTSENRCLFAPTVYTPGRSVLRWDISVSATAGTH